MDESSLDRSADLGFGTQRKVYQTKGFTNQSITVCTLKTKPFVLSLSKHERRRDTPFDKLRVNGDRLGENHRDSKRFLAEYVFSIMDSLVKKA